MEESVQQNDKIKIEKASLQSSLAEVQHKIKVQNEHEKIIAAKTEMSKTQKAEIEKLKSILSEKIESFEAKEREYIAKISELNNLLISAQKEKEILIIEVDRKY